MKFDVGVYLEIIRFDIYMQKKLLCLLLPSLRLKTVTDCISEESNKIGHFCPSVCFHCIFEID